jgi:predicted pyridoxine 5'-phosphate oxidase superfamily flavin-nucleotide-binding protein
MCGGGGLRATEERNEVMPIALTAEMTAALDNALPDRSPCLVATASREGMPDVSYRGSVLVFDSEHLAFWERAKGETLDNIRQNPGVCVFYRNAATRVGWRFYGQAEVLTDGPIRVQIMERVHPFELAQDPERIGYAILIRVDRVRERNDTLMSRD